MTIFTTTLADPRVETALDGLFRASESDDLLLEVSGERMAVMTPRERSDAAAHIYMPVPRAGGVLLYQLVRAIRPKTVLEFGMSFGISTLYLAAAVRDNGIGEVITTEMSPDKIAAARGIFTNTGLDDIITILDGDARETLTMLDRKPDFVFLDGWPELCLPVLKVLEPVLRPGTLVVADDVPLDGLAEYLAYVRDPANGYVTMRCPIDDGIEISCCV
jgi:predicted O-methyltransferase YrrM